jgi:hypothetical protein
LQKDLSEHFGLDASVISPRDTKREFAGKTDAGAVLFFDRKTVLKFIAEEFFAPLLEKTVIVCADDAAFANCKMPDLQKVFAVLTGDAEVISELEKSFAKNAVWKFDSENLAVTLAQTLSILLNTAKSEPEKPPVKSSKAPLLPVWFYWEGKRPRWIEICHETIVANAPDARFLTPESFDELWTQDRDIDVSRLYVAHRADFIRAFLLAKFGGLWIDADCLVMRDLSGLLESLGEYDFIAHRERSGLFANPFIGAKKDSVIAAELYQRVCQFLRGNGRIGWLEIGSKPLTEILNNTDAPFLELDCEQVQPICWSQPEKFFAPGSDAEHARNFNESAICYMLSNGAVINYQGKNPNADLTAENSFFTFAARRALKVDSAETVQIQSFEAPTTSENRLKSLAFYLAMISKIAPQKVLDADVGSGRWAVLLRDFFEPSSDAAPLSIEAVVEKKNGKGELLQSFYDDVAVGKLHHALEKIEEKKDLLILGDYLTRNGNFPDARVMEDSLQKTDYVLLDFYPPQNGFQPSGSERNLSQFLSANSAAIAAIQKTENIVSVLLSRHDPKNIRPASRLAEVFREMTESFAQRAEESLAGPGCSLSATAEIRRALPMLFSFLGVESMLDARCGDFNWLRHVDLRLEKFIGIDIVESLTEQNRKLYENPKRRFLRADVTRDFLPEAELILCRDFLVHLSFEDIFAALRNFQASGAKYLLTTTFPNTRTNSDIKTGDWRTLNLQTAPFDFPLPFKLINERCAGPFADKSLGLWLLADLNF